jgi:hypothetical protein
VAALEVKDISVQLDELSANPNVIYLRGKQEEYSRGNAGVTAAPTSPDA